MIVDEASRVADELYFAVRPMLAVSLGSLMMLSTPYGKRGVFFEEWSQGDGWERYEVPARACPRISTLFLEEEKRVLPARVYRQGEWWFESPGPHRRATDNASGSRPARLLAVFVVDAAQTELITPDPL